MRVVPKVLLFIVSLCVAIWIIQSGFAHFLLKESKAVWFLPEIIAGAFYTSFLTSPIALAMLIELAQDKNPLIVSLLGGAGAALGDLLLVMFLRQEIKTDLKQSIRHLKLEKMRQSFKKWHLGFVLPVMGAIIVASPLPDELGLMLWGVSNLKYPQLIILSYFLNTIGIMAIVVPIGLLQ